MNFKEHSKCLTNFDNDEKVKWMEACLFQVRADDPYALYLKYDKDFIRVDLVWCSRRSTPNSQLVLLYTGPLSNAAAKYMGALLG